MIDAETSTFHDVRDIIIRTLGIEDGRRAALDWSTPLFGGIPELDSFAVVSLAMALEEHFGFALDDLSFTAEVFDTIGTLSEFVDRSRH
jgi:acyl carrier protein